ncbi:FG-GAP-like repeat-containing protein, partial [Streptomyces sp. NPDC059467]|uniref:FG-GAP-like repeat-containing protein n=1 Tax=Streptomyces sp. NPDC059467 TaxID=3346844 RepID=UPI0036C87A5D
MLHAISAVDDADETGDTSMSFDFSDANQTVLQQFIDRTFHSSGSGTNDFGDIAWNAYLPYASDIPGPKLPHEDVGGSVSLSNGIVTFDFGQLPSVTTSKLNPLAAFVAASVVGGVVWFVSFLGCTAAFPGAAILCNTVASAIGGFVTGAVNAVLAGGATFGGWFWDALIGALGGAILAGGQSVVGKYFTDGRLVRGWWRAASDYVVRKYKDVKGWWSRVWPQVVGFIAGLLPASVRNIPDRIAQWWRTLGIVDFPPNNVRLLPLGDSITYGYGSTTSSSYRAELWKLMNNEGETPTFVGSQVSGQLPDPYSEGYPGWRIDQIAGITDKALATYHPTVVTLHAGTNDMNQNYQVDTAPARLNALVGQILADDPGVTVLVAMLVPSKDPTIQARIDAFNAQVFDLLDARMAQGEKVWVAGMGDIDPDGDLADTLHPNDNGYLKMAASFNNGIFVAAAKGWLIPPVAGSPGDNGAGSPGDNGAGSPAPGCQTGTNGWSAIGRIATGVGQSAGKVRFADYNGDGKADYWVLNDNGSVDVWLNTGTTTWTPLGQVAPGVGQPASKIRFADYNGDGKADYWVLNDNGSVDVWLNTGTTTWTPLGQVAPGVGQPAANIQFVDENCDHKDDYVVVTKSGSLYVWLNTGTTDWKPLGLYAAGVGRPGSQIRLADDDGGGRADYLVLNPNGSVDAWLSVGGGDTSGPGWMAQGQIAPSVGQPGSNVRLADYNGDGFDDYWVLNDNGSVDVWLNTGTTTWTPLGQVAPGVG